MTPPGLFQAIFLRRNSPVCTSGDTAANGNVKMQRALNEQFSCENQIKVFGPVIPGN